MSTSRVKTKFAPHFPELFLGRSSTQLGTPPRSLVCGRVPLLVPLPVPWSPLVCSPELVQVVSEIPSRAFVITCESLGRSTRHRGDARTTAHQL